ncbi:MAG: hypothetical protein AAGD32_10925 [Planctomycetota bacterium]
MMPDEAALKLQTPHLTDAGRAVLMINPARAYRTLVPSESGSAEARAALEPLDAYKLTPTFPAAPEAANAALAGLWLWHDFLHESHQISQSIDNPTGSFWHMIMHRREGDFSNAKYWVRQTGRHPLFPSIAAKADDLVRPMLADKRFLRLTANGWDASAFVDLVESVADTPDDPAHRVTVGLQQLEWRVLFDECMGQAVG